jgi:hypothetical protein
MSAEFMEAARRAREKAASLKAAAADLHRQGWDRVLRMAQQGGYARYALYASRSLAVPHPEIYLRGDALFWQVASTVPGFRDAYGIRYAADMYMMQWYRALAAGLPLSEPLCWDDIPADVYSVIRARAPYPDGYPFFPFLDQRMAPLAVSLKTTGNCVTGLERAEHEYFRARADGVQGADMFLVLCDDESAYLAQGDTLRAMATLSTVERVSGNPVLIFNEDAVWYPLMGRDDTARSPALADLVGRLRTDRTTPALTAVEAQYVPLLRAAGALTSERQRDMTMLASLRAHGIQGDPYDQVWVRSVTPRDLYNDKLCSRRQGIVRECNRYAATLSPVSAYMAALVATAPSRPIGLAVLSGEYLKHVGVVRDDEKGWKKPGRLEAWGHLWYCPLMEYTIDDGWRSGGGHCVSQAINLSAALDLAGIDHYVTHFNRGGVLTMDHHFVSSSDGEWVLDDAMLNFFAAGVQKTDNWGCLLSFSKDGLWSSLVIDEFFGNIPPDQVLSHVQRLEALIAGRFPLNFLSPYREPEMQPKEGWLAYLKTVRDWQPVTVP